MSSRYLVKKLCVKRVYFSTKLKPGEDTTTVFPREREGNIYKVNWSMVEDGVTPVGDAFQNARFALLATKLGISKQSKLVKVNSPNLLGNFKLLEAGISLSHDEFQDSKTSQKKYLESGIELFVEDASLGSYYDMRVGVRIISDNPSWSLIGRHLLVKKYPFSAFQKFVLSSFYFLDS
jgi:hypothetical protein